ncbi:DNA-binding LacI/PurR family transcriptional regulator [Allocatelliglobosispora scoriae]|uniref:DNA-binding LacI/PurR family transcriptional regulator n=1 Tax=Allocatelliglobosispora scoriae TaxID=643052 RepID=A0A841BL96_9ACTN|nr:LacI family DNA-binding transcriptional regulator [Allocatelliglobosispora scoriae]MBB5869064.1 DNA-binding LacI/PurR family transcriptional regulator [Allocatelliglobosispora scoriae]
MAKTIGVSRATVSRVINKVPTVDPVLRQTVERAIEATGYVPNQAARSLVTRRTDSVALVISEPEHRHFDDPFFGRVFTDPFFGRMVSGAMSVLRPLGIQLVLMLAENADARAKLMTYLRQGHVDGVIIDSTHLDDPLPQQIVELGLPIVLCGRPAKPYPISYVDVDHQSGARLAADHLVARGCQEVGTISGPLDMSAAQDRLTGFRAGMAQHGHAYIPCVEGNFTVESGERAMEQLLDEHPRLDGVFAANDLMAQGALTVLAARGRRVPQDVAVIGFDDSSAAVSSRPPLTTVRQPLEDMAAAMARNLMNHVEDAELRVSSHIFEPTLVIRESA